MLSVQTGASAERRCQFCYHRTPPATPPDPSSGAGQLPAPTWPPSFSTATHWGHQNPEMAGVWDRLEDEDKPKPLFLLWSVPFHQAACPQAKDDPLEPSMHPEGTQLQSCSTMLGPRQLSSEKQPLLPPRSHLKSSPHVTSM